MFFTGADKVEVLKYLGIKNGEADREYIEKIDQYIKLLLDEASPKYTYAVFEIESHNPVKLKGTNVTFSGSDIEKHLEKADKVILLAATLGYEADKIIRTKSVINMADAVIVDSCASGGIENLCNNLTSYLEKEYEVKNLYLTDRFSPGYGDFPIECQHDLCLLTQSQKKIGLTCTRFGALEPVKSVTAVIGIGDMPFEKRITGCASCRLKSECSYRKRGVTCYENDE